MATKITCNTQFLKRAFIAAAAPLLILSAAPAMALTSVSSFGSNPGALQMFKHVPSGMPSNAPLVVALHGCTQTAAAYEASGWTALANTHKFYVLYPQQVSGNNSNKCFNWFESGDIARGAGEALSIKQMVDTMKSAHSIDGNRVFITGLSAGAYMTTVMAVTYPDVFVGAAPIAGGPYKCGIGVSGAFSCMSPGVDKTPTAWGDLARSGYSGYTGRKPKFSIWHGSSDTTVKPMNMNETMEQATNYAGIDQTAEVSNTVGGFPHKVYNSGGTPWVETYSITSMGHGTPVDPGTGSAQCGTAGAYILDVNVCSSYYIAQFFGILSGSGTTTTTAGSGTTTTTASTPTTTVASGACFKVSNYAHVTAGRAYNSMGTAKANGSNQSMGLYNTFVITKLRQTGTNYYVIDSSCP